MITQIGSVEPNLLYGGDFAFFQGGELELIMDVPQNYSATYQRIMRLVCGIPVITDNQDNPIGRPDDLFNTDFGSGLKAFVGLNLTPHIHLQITQNILNSLIGDPGLDQNSVPVVVITAATNIGGFYVTITATLSNGAIITFPSVLISTL